MAKKELEKIIPFCAFKNCALVFVDRTKSKLAHLAMVSYFSQIRKMQTNQQSNKA